MYYDQPIAYEDASSVSEKQYQARRQSLLAKKDEILKRIQQEAHKGNFSVDVDEMSYALKLELQRDGYTITEKPKYKRFLLFWRRKCGTKYHICWLKR